MARGFLESDDEWDICLTEVSFFQTGSQLRQLFTVILLYNNPAEPLALFNRHYQHLSDDCQYHLQNDFHIASPTDQQTMSLSLEYIQVLLQHGNKSLADFDLLESVMQIDNFHRVPQLIAEEMNYDICKLQLKYHRGYRQANVDQKQIIDAVLSAVDSQDGGIFFIDGPRGTGKT